MLFFIRHFLLLIIFLPRFFPSFILARHLLSRDTNQPIPANELRKISSYSGFIAVPSHNLVSSYILDGFYISPLFSSWFTLIRPFRFWGCYTNFVYVWRIIQRGIVYVRTIFCEIMFVDLIFFGYMENVFIILYINCTLLAKSLNFISLLKTF